MSEALFAARALFGCAALSIGRLLARRRKAPVVRMPGPSHSARLRAYPSLFAIAWSMSLLSVFCCSGDVIAPTIGSPTMLPFLSTT